MTDLHAQIRAEVERRLAIARAAEPGPWEIGPTFGARDNRVYVRQVGDLIDSIGTCVIAAQVPSMPRFRANASFIAEHHPDDAQRRYEYALKVLDMHQWRAPGVNCGCDKGMCSCGEHVPWPCDELIWLATSLGIEVPS